MTWPLGTKMWQPLQKRLSFIMKSYVFMLAATVASTTSRTAAPIMAFTAPLRVRR